MISGLELVSLFTLKFIFSHKNLAPVEENINKEVGVDHTFNNNVNLVELASKCETSE